MKMRSTVMLIAMGVGGTLLYQQIRNGNAKRCIQNMERVARKTYDDLEDMM